MPATSAELLGLFELSPRASGGFRAASPQHSVLAKAYGGQYIAQALLACELHLDDPGRIPHSLHGTFLSAGESTGSLDIHVETLRDGRSFSMRRAQVLQGARTTFDATVSFHLPEAGLEHAAPPPAVPAPEHCRQMVDVIDATGGLGSQMWRDEWPVLDMRYADGATDDDWSLRRDVPSAQRFWVKTRDPMPDDARLHRAMVAYLSDLSLLASALLPHGYFVSAPEIPRASLNHSLWLHEPARADEWLLFDQGSSWAGGGRGHGIQRVYSRDGRLVATVAQEGLIRSVSAR